MTPVEVFAPAKINLALHVTGRRADGYHLLDSLVTFADVGDRIRVAPSDTLTLNVTGPFAGGVSTTDNLVLEAARLVGVTAAIELEKTLPVAAGIGGGSADAAATLRALCRMTNQALPDRAAQMTLGADVPVCMTGGLLRMEGAGEDITVLDARPPSLPMVLVNPGVGVSTPSVFAALTSRDNALLETPLPDWMSDDFLSWLARQRNDLEAPARAAAPVIDDVLAALRATKGAALARMSGSGATCFALYPDERDATAASEALKADHPEWWVAGAHL